jgi:hypothetical protein
MNPNFPDGLLEAGLIADVVRAQKARSISGQNDYPAQVHLFRPLLCPDLGRQKIAETRLVGRFVGRRPDWDCD